MDDRIRPGIRRWIRPRGAPAAAVAAAVMSGFLIAIPPAHADGQRPPESMLPGMTPPNVASAVIGTNIVIDPAAGETFPQFTVLSVQVAPMAKVRRDGSIDPDHAIAQWFFTIRFPRSSAPWPPFLPEPTDPWGYHFYEMPDGELTGIGVDLGSPLYPPPANLPADWLSRLVPAAKAAIPAETFQTSIRDALARFPRPDRRAAGRPRPHPARGPAGVGIGDRIRTHRGQR